MENNQDNIDIYEIVIWNMIKSLSDVKEYVENSKDDRRKDLMELQNKMQEASQWMIKNTIE